MKHDAARLDATWKLLRGWHREGHCRAIAAETGAVSGEAHRLAVGQLSAEDTTPVTSDSIFLIASPTKPIVATAAMMLVESGDMQLDHRVRRYLPEFRGGGKGAVRIAHLLTHTSGLPDMVPDNQALREAHAPLSDFLQQVCGLELGAPAGTRVRYQSTGFLTLAAVMERITKTSLPELLQECIFGPLQMHNTALGAPDEWDAAGHWKRMTHSQVEDREGANEWGWNSRYWRTLGAPWGGLLSTATDLGRLCRHLLAVHQGEAGILAPTTMRAMTTNQLAHLPGLDPVVVRTTPWGLGWQPNWPLHPRGFGSLVPAGAFGHWGATGTLLWLDPVRGVYGVFLSTEPIEMEDRRPIAFANLASLVWQSP